VRTSQGTRSGAALVRGTTGGGGWRSSRREREGSVVGSRRYLAGSCVAVVFFVVRLGDFGDLGDLASCFRALALPDEAAKAVVDFGCRITNVARETRFLGEGAGHRRWESLISSLHGIRVDVFVSKFDCVRGPPGSPDGGVETVFLAGDRHLCEASCLEQRILP